MAHVFHHAELTTGFRIAGFALPSSIYLGYPKWFVYCTGEALALLNSSGQLFRVGVSGIRLMCHV